MRIEKMISAVDTHVCGEPGRVIVGGVLDVPGSSMFDKKCYLEEHADQSLSRLQSLLHNKRKRARSPQGSHDDGESGALSDIHCPVCHNPIPLLSIAPDGSARCPSCGQEGTILFREE